MSDSELARFSLAWRMPCSTRFIMLMRTIWRDTSVPNTEASSRLQSGIFSPAPLR